MPQEEHWSIRERETCLAALQSCGEDASQIAGLVGTKTTQQVEKYLQDRSLSKKRPLCSDGATWQDPQQRSKGQKVDRPASSATSESYLLPHTPCMPGHALLPQAAEGSWSWPGSFQSQLLDTERHEPCHHSVPLLSLASAWHASEAGLPWPFSRPSHALWDPMFAHAPTGCMKSGLDSFGLRGPASWQMQRLTESACAAGSMGPATPPKRYSGQPAQHGPRPPAPGLLSSVPLSESERPQDGPPQPDFGVVYAFLGSLFDEGLKRQRSVDHQALLQDLGPGDRIALRRLLQDLTASLRRPGTVQAFWEELHHGEPQPGSGGRDFRHNT